MQTQSVDRNAARYDEARRRFIKVRTVPVLVLLAVINIIIIVIAIIHPVPSFALSASLFYIQSKEANAYSKRSSVFERIPELLPREATPRHLEARCAPAASAGRCTPYWTDVELTSTTRFQTRTRTRTRTTTATTTRTPIPSVTPPVGSVINRVDAGTFVALWIGVLGVCLQRASGSLICTGSSLTPNFRSTYEQSRLGTAITSRLPASTAGPTIGFVMGILLYGIFIGYLTLATATPKYIWTPFGRKASPAAHYQWTVCVCALISSGALFSVAISVIQIRNGFAGALTSIEAIAPDLKTDTGSSFSQLYAVCGIGGALLLGVIALTALMGETQVKRKLTANQDYSFDLLENLQAISQMGSGAGSSVA